MVWSNTSVSNWRTDPSDLRPSGYGGIKSAVLIGLFCFFLYPLGVGELSVNYTFTLYPLAIVLYTNRFVKPPPDMIVGVVVFSLIFVLASLYYIQMFDIVHRRLGSFLVFMSLFSYSVINVQPHLVLAFRKALILVSVFFSLVAIIVFLEALAKGPLHFEAKNLVGSQRYGFIHILAFWLVLLGVSVKQRILSYVLLTIIVSGLFLTFSRSSIIALAGSFWIFAIVRIYQGLRRPNVRKWFRFVMAGAVSLSIVPLIWYIFPLTLEYYAEQLVRPLLDGSLFEALDHKGSSEGLRVIKATESLQYVLEHPFIGTGYLGIWSFSESGSGSTHNQLLDTLIRVGILGFVLYIYLIFCLLRFLAKFDSPFFWGMIGVLIYGLFHETFKESQGAFVLAFLFGIFSQHVRDCRDKQTFDRLQ